MNEEQVAMWNGPSGRAWIESQPLLDEVLRPFEDALVAEDLGASVLDVGCGTGSTTLAIARQGARVTGIDISEPMLAVAKQRAAAAGVTPTFIVADAADYDFGDSRFDTIVSRFGVMFFEDPVRAFANLRRVGKRLHLIAWRGPADNTFMTAAERAAAPFLPQPPIRRPNAPGQFGFGDRAYVREVLEASGWRDLDITPLDRACTMSVPALDRYITRMGPVGRVLAEMKDEALRARVTEEVRKAFRPFVAGDQARFDAACWRITARL